MAYRLVFLMDPYDTLDLETETSLLLMEELIDRGHRVYWLQQEGLVLRQGTPLGQVRPVTRVEPLALGEPSWCELNDFDAMLVRKDPPFDVDYLHITLVVDQVRAGVLQFNPPAALRNYNEKLLPLRWPDLAPPTLVTRDAGILAAFAQSHGQILLKPLEDCSGRGIHRINWREGGDIAQLCQQLLNGPDGQPRFVLAQKFLKQVAGGDKRVYLIDGKPAGVVNRVPRGPGELANIHRGARCEAAGLTRRERRALATLEPFLRGEGIFLAGADFIGGYLTELNITSPSAVRQINQVTGGALHSDIVDGILRRLDAAGPQSYPRGQCFGPEAVNRLLNSH